MKNQCNFIGRLGADPEVRTMQSGKPVVNLSLAVSEAWRDKSTGEKRENTEWIPIVIFSEGLCKVAQNYLRKGSLIDITGAFKTRKWQDQSGQDRYKTEIVLTGFNASLVMLDGRTEGSQGGYGGNDTQSQPDIDETARKAAQMLDGDIVNSGGAVDMEDHIPFNMEWRA